MRINPRGLFFKIFFGLWTTLMLFSITPIVFFMLGNQANRNTFYKMAKRDIEKGLYKQIRIAAREGDTAKVHKIIDSAENRLGIDIYIFDKNNKEIDGQSYPAMIDDLLAEMSDGKLVLIKQLPGADDDSVVRIIRTENYILASYPNGEEPKSYIPAIIWHHINILIHILILSSVASLVIVRYFVKPLLTLSKASRQIAEGDFSVRVSDKVNSGDEIGILAKDFDIMTQKLEMNRDNQETMLRNISHELRSPLTRLRLSLELARGKSDASIYPALDRIENESEKLNEMIGKLIEISRIKATDNIHPDPMDINDILKSIIKDCSFEAAETGKELRSDDIISAQIYANPELLKSALENVIRNAIKYAENTVTLRNEISDGKLIIEVKDDGCGVPEEHLVNIFTAFYRVQSDRDRKTGGTGLGLAIAKAVIEAHRGDITALNCMSGGLMIRVTLPMY